MKWLLVLLALAAACDASKPARPTVVLWHAYDGPERLALEAEAATYQAAHPELELVLTAIPFDAFPDKITVAIPNGNGPDLFIYAHDRIGGWAEAGLLAPVELYVDDALADHFDTQSLAALAYGGSLYGLPLAVKSLALFYRTDLIATPPATTDELLAIGRKLTDRAAGRFGLVYENSKLYGHAAWLFGFGGGLFDAEGHVQLQSAGALRAIEFAKALGAEDGIVPAEASGALVTTLFQEGRAAMALSGPWLVSSLRPGTPFAVAPMPIVSATGKPAAPFLGVEAILMSSRAHDRRAAFAVMAAFTADDAALRRALAARQVVPNRAAYDDPRLGGDAILSAFRRQAAVAQPMPSSPAMRAVWTPYDNALQKVLAQGADPATALRDAETEVRGYVEAGP